MAAKLDLKYTQAAARGYIEQVKEAPPAQRSAKDAMGMTMLHHAAHGGRLEVVKYLASCKEVSINDQDNSGDTALHKAVWADDLPIVKFLLERKADATIINGRDKEAADLARSEEMTKFFDDLISG